MSKNKLLLTEKLWKNKLSKEQFNVLRLKNTERPFTGKYNDCLKNGIYHCSGCDSPLYKSESKFKTGCGWPSFFEGIPDAIKSIADSDGIRTEIVCSKCDGHLGHVFKNEGYSTPTNERHCVNSVCLILKENK